MVRSGDALSHAAEISNAAPAPMRILVIDDHPLVSQALRDTLERDGHCVITANGGEAGIDIFGPLEIQGKLSISC